MYKYLIIAACLSGCANMPAPDPEAVRQFLAANQAMQQRQYELQMQQLQSYRPPVIVQQPIYQQPAYQPPRQINCTSTRFGNQVQTYCN